MSRPWLPARDHVQAPYTGFGRTHWAAVADHLLHGAARYASPEGASVVLPGPRAHAVTGLEGFARTFLLACLRIGSGDRPDLVERAARALHAGSCRGAVESWPRLQPHGQEVVEAAAIALGLHLSRDHLWDLLDEQTRDQLVDWLGGGRGSCGADNNHVLFPALLQAFLGSVGAPHDPTEVDRALTRIEDFYVGDGWYTDGVGRRFDHYSGWAMHLYPLLIARMSDLPAMQQLYAQRLARFLEDYQHLVGPSGAPVHQGRSLIYRWAVTAPFWLGAMSGVSPLSHGQTRRLTGGVLKAFVDRGVVDDPILVDGWFRPFAPLAQGYSGPGSAYWVSKGFLGLLLPAEHPLWVAREEPVDTDTGDVSRVLAAPGWLVHSTTDDQVLRLLNHGSDGHPRRDDDHYRRLAFSDRTGPEVGAMVRDNVVDVVVDGEPAQHTGLLARRVLPLGAASRYVLDVGRDVTVDVVSVLVQRAEVRVARVRGAVGLPLRLSGWALAGEDPPRAGSDEHQAWAVAADGLTSVVVPLLAGTPALHRSKGTNAFGTHSAVPSAEVAAAPEPVRYAAAMVSLHGADWTPMALLADLAVDIREHEVEVRAGGRPVVVPWAADEVCRSDRLGQGVFTQDGGRLLVSVGPGVDAGGASRRPTDGRW